MGKVLTNLLNEEALTELAGERAFDRGADYFVDGHLVGLKATDETIAAKVREHITTSPSSGLTTDNSLAHHACSRGKDFRDAN